MLAEHAIAGVQGVPVVIQIMELILLKCYLGNRTNKQRDLVFGVKRRIVGFFLGEAGSCRGD